MIYLTYGEPLSGVYQSQVIDVCRFIQARFGIPVRIVAFVSPRRFFQARRAIRAHAPNAIVIPALPRVTNWSLSVVTFALICTALKPPGVIARSVPATNLALWIRRLRLTKRVCYDGRGAIAAERHEYLRSTDKETAAYQQLEAAAVNQSDFRIAVSNKLVDYWRSEYGYTNSTHAVIPCTLASMKGTPPGDTEHIATLRSTMGFGPADVVIVYAGSTAGWQSLHALCDFLSTLTLKQHNLRVLMLCPPDPKIADLINAHEGRITRRFVDSANVPAFLAACDFGLLIREPSVTNLVASPVKVAEYLAAGLPVILSSGIGDYDDFVRQHGCGYVIKGADCPALSRPSHAERSRIAALAETHLSKEAHARSYFKVITNTFQPQRTP